MIQPEQIIFVDNYNFLYYHNGKFIPEENRIAFISPDYTKYKYFYDLNNFTILVTNIKNSVVEENLPTFIKSNIKIIALTGLKGCGKTTIANYIVEHIPNTIQLTFAEPLKQATMAIFGLTEKQAYGSIKEKEAVMPFWGISPRRMFQLQGDLYRDILPKLEPKLEGVFKRKLELEIINLYKENKPVNIIVSDLRYPDELEMLKNYGTTIIKIHNPRNFNIDHHSSENQKLDYDILFENNCSLDSLYEKTKTQLFPLFGGLEIDKLKL